MGDKAALHIGAVAFIHRFGSSLNEHVHFHVCVVDAVFEVVPGQVDADATVCPAGVIFHSASGINEAVCLAGALHHVIRCCKQAAYAKRKNDGIGMQGSQASVGQPGNIKVERRQLRGDPFLTCGHDLIRQNMSHAFQSEVTGLPKAGPVD